MQEVSLDYMALLAEQLAFVSAFLGGFSATFLGTLLAIQNTEGPRTKMIVVLAMSAAAFIVAVLGFTGMVVFGHPDNPIPLASYNYMRVSGILTFAIGIYSLLGAIGLSGYMISKKIGRTTLLIATSAAVLTFFMLFDYGS